MLCFAKKLSCISYDASFTRAGDVALHIVPFLVMAHFFFKEKSSFIHGQ